MRHGKMAYTHKKKLIDWTNGALLKLAEKLEIFYGGSRFQVQRYSMADVPLSMKTRTVAERLANADKIKLVTVDEIRESTGQNVLFQDKLVALSSNFLFRLVGPFRSVSVHFSLKTSPPIAWMTAASKRKQNRDRITTKLWR